MNSVTWWITKLQKLLNDADFDGAVKLIGTAQNVIGIVSHWPVDTIDGWHARCLMAEVLDYAGRAGLAHRVILAAVPRARLELEREAAQPKRTVPRDRAADLKQLCLVYLHYGMARYYRRQSFAKAQDAFDLARRVLVKVHRVVPSWTSISRVYYCLGLVARERHQYNLARKHFSKSAECAWMRMNAPTPAASTRYAEYNIARALGLGMAWLAYARASISDASAHAVAARLLLKDKKVDLIRAYVDVVYACAEGAAFADQIKRISHSIELLENALKVFSCPGKPKRNVKGNPLYTLRCQMELATAHLRAAQRYLSSHDGAMAKHHLKTAEEQTDDVLRSYPSTSADPDIYVTDKRALAQTHIVRSRIFRQRGDVPAALKSAEEAMVSAGTPFSKIDATINLGEAHYHSGNYDKALDLFTLVRGNRNAQSNVKVLAVCNLHMARCHLKLREDRQARDIYHRWENSGRQGQENAFVRELESEVRGMLQSEEPGLFIPGDTPLSWKDSLTKTKKWVVGTALRRCNNSTKRAADLLHLSVRTVKDYSRS